MEETGSKYPIGPREARLRADLMSRPCSSVRSPTGQPGAPLLVAAVNFVGGSSGVHQA